MSEFLAALSAVSEIFSLGWKVWQLRAEAIHKGWVTNERSLGDQISNATEDDTRASLARKLFEHRAE